MHHVGPYVLKRGYQAAQLNLVSSTKPRAPAMIMAVDVKYPFAGVQGSLHRTPNGRPRDPGTHMQIVQVMLVRDRDVVRSKHEDGACFALAMPNVEKAHSFCGDFMGPRQVLLHAVKEGSGNPNVYVHCSALRWVAIICASRKSVWLIRQEKACQFRSSTRTVPFQ